MKVAYGKIVESSYAPQELSLRGPLGRSQKDDIRPHLKRGGFEENDEVAIILKSDLERLVRFFQFGLEEVKS